MLETVRQYGLQVLAEIGEAEETRRRHASFYVQIAEQADESLRDIRQVASMNLLDTEHDNLRGALRWATDNGEADLGFRLVGALGWFWFMPLEGILAVVPDSQRFGSRAGSYITGKSHLPGCRTRNHPR